MDDLPAYFDSKEVKESRITDGPKIHEQLKYAGDFVDDSGPLEIGGWRKLDFSSPALLLAFYDSALANQIYTLHKWQVDDLELLANAQATSQHPFKYCLITCNGSGKDAIIIASFVIWFALCKIRSRSITTSASGVQLTSQTEGYIKGLAQKVNTFHGCEIFKIRQRFIKCMLTGSEIRLFATDEEGKAEGYHPFEPNSEMAIIVNEGKSVSEEIHNALRRCTGYNYWLEVSTPGEPKGFFYKAATFWPNVRRVTTYDCPHLSKDEVEADKLELGEHSPLFRSKHLALFTSVGGEVIIPQDLLEACFHNPPDFDIPSLGNSVGIDLAAGGDEIVLCFSSGNKIVKELWFRESDTEITAIRIDSELKSNGYTFESKTIYADDGGVGKSIIDKLVHKGWIFINRVVNQSAAISRTLYGNKGAENWYRVKRLIEEKVLDISKCSQKTLEQLYTRHYKTTTTSARIFLESKKEARAHGRQSPDRADALILSQTGKTIFHFIEGRSVKSNDRPSIRFASQDEIAEYYENNVTFENYNKQQDGKRRVHGSLQVATRNN